MNIQSSLFKIRNDFYDIYIFFFTDLNRRSNHTCHFFFTIRAIVIHRHNYSTLLQNIFNSGKRCGLNSAVTILLAILYTLFIQSHNPKW